VKTIGRDQIYSKSEVLVHGRFKVIIALDSETLARCSPGLTALASDLQEHTALQEFGWFICGSRILTAPPDLSPDPVLRALPACPHFRNVFIMTASTGADAVQYLLQLPTDTKLRLILEADKWLAAVDDIRQGHCNIKDLCLDMLLITRSKETEAFKAIALAQFGWIAVWNPLIYK
jgi:hypothetical protein